MLGMGRDRAKLVPQLSCELRKCLLCMASRPLSISSYEPLTNLPQQVLTCDCQVVKGHGGRGEEHSGCVGRANIMKGEAEVMKVGYKSSGSLVLLLMEQLPGTTFIAGCRNSKV